MYKIIIISSVIFILSCRHSKNIEKDLPIFTLLLVDSVTQFNTKWIADGKASALMYFSPDCEHCQKETESILDHIDSLKGIQFYFITNDPFDRLQVYNKMYKLYKYSNITLGWDYNFYFLSHFKDAAPPYLIVYDKYKRERAVFSGEAKASALVTFLHNL